MKKPIKRLLSVAAGFYLKRRFATYGIDPDSDVAEWRIRAIGEGCSLRVKGGSMVEARITFERSAASVIVGHRTFIGNSMISCAELVEIGDDVLVAWGAAIFDHGSHSIGFLGRSKDVESWRRGEKDWSAVRTMPTRIGNKCWIGYSAIVLPGVTVGEGAVVGAGSVVTRDVEPWTVVAGNPAKLVRKVSESE